MSEIRIYADHDLLTRAAAEYVVGLYETAVAQHGHFSIVLSGGSTPRALYQLLAQQMFSQYVDWSKVYFFWGDERCVPPDDEQSNYRMARLALLDEVDVPLSNIYRMHGEREPAEAAAAYEQQLHEFFRNRPPFNLILLGLGDDGHTASLFPNTAALDETERWVAANYVPKLEAWRLTLTATAINTAQHVAFIVTGAGKAGVVHEVLEGPRQARELPSQLIQPDNLTWFLDEAAARLLNRTV